MSTNMELITSVTVGSGGAASVTLPATGTIPQTYTDLYVLMSVRTAGGGPADTVTVQFNGSASNFTSRILYGDGASAASAGRSDGYIGFMNAGGSTANTFSSASLYIPNYTSSNNKSYSADKVSEQNGTTAYAELTAGLRSNTAAITSLTFVSAGSFNIVEGSTFYLYGISNVTSTTKATGGIVSSDGTYNYHMFPYSGTFTPTTAISADVLLIAGGGGGGSAQGGGGGGAGGVRLHTTQSLTATGYTVTVGAGGTGSGGSGVDSSFTGLTSASGGSGGGAGNGGNGGASGAPTSFAGGTGNVGNKRAGGGGGSGAVGANAGTDPGAGGAGINTYSTWANATQTGVSNGYYAGGGGGGRGDIQSQTGAGGIGGGGTGGTPFATELPGTINTGSGGGGGRDNTNGALGGSGLVIIRYAI
jgi:hypothetical protein